MSPTRDGKIWVRVRVCSFRFRTRMTIYYSGFRNKPGFLNSGCGSGSTRKNSGFCNPGFEPGSGWAPFLGLFRSRKPEVGPCQRSSLQLFSITDCFNIKTRVIFKSKGKFWLKNITNQWSKSAKQNPNFVIVSFSSSNKS